MPFALSGPGAFPPKAGIPAPRLRRSNRRGGKDPLTLSGVPWYNDQARQDPTQRPPLSCLPFRPAAIEDRPEGPRQRLHHPNRASKKDRGRRRAILPGRAPRRRQIQATRRFLPGRREPPSGEEGHPRRDQEVPKP